ncbi:MAG TPA: hypothetical protein VF511_09470 [Chthoniobacterales bacterium]|jgi:hypothetical protein
MFVEGGLHPEQVKALRKMTLQRRLELALAGIESVDDRNGSSRPGKGKLRRVD